MVPGSCLYAATFLFWLLVVLECFLLFSYTDLVFLDVDICDGDRRKRSFSVVAASSRKTAVKNARREGIALARSSRDSRLYSWILPRYLVEWQPIVTTKKLPMPSLTGSTPEFSIVQKRLFWQFALFNILAQKQRLRFEWSDRDNFDVMDYVWLKHFLNLQRFVVFLARVQETSVSITESCKPSCIVPRIWECCNVESQLFIELIRQ